MILFFLREWLCPGIIKRLSQVCVIVPALLRCPGLGLVHPTTVTLLLKVVDCQSGTSLVRSSGDDIFAFTNSLEHIHLWSTLSQEKKVSRT